MIKFVFLETVQEVPAGGFVGRVLNVTIPDGYRFLCVHYAGTYNPNAVAISSYQVDQGKLYFSALSTLDYTISTTFTFNLAVIKTQYIW